MITGSTDDAKSVVRTEPSQRRSAERLDALLDAAALVVDEVGADRLTTQLVAERSGASIGTVYRYFPDRVAVLQGLRERSVRRFRERLAASLQQVRVSAWWEVFDLVIDVAVECYRREAGFRLLRGSDRDRTGATAPAIIAERILAVIEDEFGPVPGVEPGELRVRVDAAVEVADALISRAAVDGRFDERYLALCRESVHSLLAPVFVGLEQANAA
nr:TetR/AcrR family transcriptional regulator [Agromyces seonyuensis]